MVGPYVIKNKKTGRYFNVRKSNWNQQGGCSWWHVDIKDATTYGTKGIAKTQRHRALFYCMGANEEDDTPEEFDRMVSKYLSLIRLEVVEVEEDWNE